MLLCFTLLLMAVSIYVLSHQPGEIMFRISLFFLVATIFFLLPYLFGLAAIQDSSGRGGPYAVGSFFFSGAISPALGGILVEFLELNILGYLMVGITGISILIIILVTRSTVEARIS